MNELLLGLMLWIGKQTEYDIDLPLPNVVITTPHNLCAQYGIKEKARCDAQQLRGFYDKHITIYLDSQFDYDRPHHQSWLLHELVHYVQWANGRDHTLCLGHLELEAFDLADRWRAVWKLKPMLADFNRMMLAASCG